MRQRKVFLEEEEDKTRVMTFSFYLLSTLLLVTPFPTIISSAAWSTSVDKEQSFLPKGKRDLLVMVMPLLECPPPGCLNSVAFFIS